VDGLGHGSSDARNAVVGSNRVFLARGSFRCLLNSGSCVCDCSFRYSTLRRFLQRRIARKARWLREAQDALEAFEQVCVPACIRSACG
jgi:hypothetical protein